MADGSDRKRKRAEDSAPRSKKQKTSTPFTTTVSEVLKSKKSPLVVATVSGLKLSNELRFRPQEQPRVQAPLDRRLGRRSSGRTLVLKSSSHPTTDYTALEEHSDGKVVLKHYVGVYDPETGTLQVVEAKKMAIQATVRPREFEGEAPAEPTKTKGYMELRNQLGESFGTKKAKKALEAATLNAVKSQGSKDGTPKALTAADRALIENIKQSSQGRATQEELQAIADEAKPIPKINTAAESIHDVYDPVAILGSEVLTAIPVHDWLEAVRNGQTLQFQSTFVANRICRVALAAKDTTRLRVLRYLFFMILIVRYAKPGRVRGTLNIPPRKILQQLCQPAPDLVIDDLRTRFARDDVMLKVHMDLLATHCAAFSLIVDNYESDVRDLTFDLKLEPAKMRQYFYEIGVRIKTVSAGEKGAQRSIAKLTLPLTFPKLRRGPGQKRR